MLRGPVQLAAQDRARAVRPRLALDEDVAGEAGQVRLPGHRREAGRVGHGGHVGAVGPWPISPAAKPANPAPSAKRSSRWVAGTSLADGFAPHVDELGEEELDAPVLDLAADVLQVLRPVSQRRSLPLSVPGRPVRARARSRSRADSRASRSLTILMAMPSDSQSSCSRSNPDSCSMRASRWRSVFGMGVDGAGRPHDVAPALQVHLEGLEQLGARGGWSYSTSRSSRSCCAVPHARPRRRARSGRARGPRRCTRRARSLMSAPTSAAEAASSKPCGKRRRAPAEVRHADRHGGVAVPLDLLVDGARRSRPPCAPAPGGPGPAPGSTSPGSRTPRPEAATPAGPRGRPPASDQRGGPRLGVPLPDGRAPLRRPAGPGQGVEHDERRRRGRGPAGRPAPPAHSGCRCPGRAPRRSP